MSKHGQKKLKYMREAAEVELTETAPIVPEVAATADDKILEISKTLSLRVSVEPGFYYLQEYTTDTPDKTKMLESVIIITSSEIPALIAALQSL